MAYLVCFNIRLSYGNQFGMASGQSLDNLSPPSPKWMLDWRHEWYYSGCWETRWRHVCLIVPMISMWIENDVMARGCMSAITRTHFCEGNEKGKEKKLFENRGNFYSEKILRILHNLKDSRELKGRERERKKTIFMLCRRRPSCGPPFSLSLKEGRGFFFEKKEILEQWRQWFVLELGEEGVRHNPTDTHTHEKI